MTSIEIELRATLITLRGLMSELIGDLAKAVEETDPTCESYILMEKLTVIADKYSEKIERLMGKQSGT